MVTIVFEAHSTSLDNEAHLASGHNDVELSELGKRQAKELSERYENEKFDAIFCSDLQRSYQTAETAFGNKFPIIKDKRLRECDYGDLTQHPSSEVEPLKVSHISTPFPNGESYEQTSTRMESFLDELKKNYAGKKVMIIGHRATQYGLEHLKGLSYEKIITTPWSWQPGWNYYVK